MKKLIDKYITKSGFAPLYVVLFDILVISELIFPGLTIANTLLNVLTLFFIWLVFVFNYFYFKFDSLLEDIKKQFFN